MTSPATHSSHGTPHLSSTSQATQTSSSQGRQYSVRIVNSAVWKVAEKTLSWAGGLACSVIGLAYTNSPDHQEPDPAEFPYQPAFIALSVTSLVLGGGMHVIRSCVASSGEGGGEDNGSDSA